MNHTETGEVAVAELCDILKHISNHSGYIVYDCIGSPTVTACSGFGHFAFSLSAESQGSDNIQAAGLY